MTTFSAHFSTTVVDDADIIHAPSHKTIMADPHRQPTACGRALRACSNDITVPLTSDFEALLEWQPGWVDDRLCFECKQMVA